MKRAAANLCALCVGLFTFVVVIAQPKPYPPTGPYEPFVKIDANVPYSAKATLYFKVIAPDRAVGHIALLMIHGDEKILYTSRQAEFEKDHANNGALLLVAMADELVKQAAKDGFEITSKQILEHTNVEQE
jgi:hypothetical protein